MDAALSPLLFSDWLDSIASDSSASRREHIALYNNPEVLLPVTNASEDGFFSVPSTKRVLGAFQEQAECRWAVKSHQVIGYNCAFLRLFEIAEFLLESDFKWEDFGLFSLEHPATQRTAEIIRQGHDTMISGLESATRFQFPHVTPDGRVKHIDVFATCIEEEIRWICLERPEDYADLLARSNLPVATGLPRGKRSATLYDSLMQTFVWKTPTSLATNGLHEPPCTKRRRTKKGNAQ